MILMKNEHVPEEWKLHLKICYDFILGFVSSIPATCRWQCVPREPDMLYKNCGTIVYQLFINFGLGGCEQIKNVCTHIFLEGSYYHHTSVPICVKEDLAYIGACDFIDIIGWGK